MVASAECRRLTLTRFSRVGEGRQRLLFQMHLALDVNRLFKASAGAEPSNSGRKPIQQDKVDSASDRPTGESQRPTGESHRFAAGIFIEVQILQVT